MDKLHFSCTLSNCTHVRMMHIQQTLQQTHTHIHTFLHTHSMGSCTLSNCTHVRMMHIQQTLQQTHTYTLFYTHTQYVIQYVIMDCKLPLHGGEFWQSAYNNFHKTGPNTTYTLFSFLSACFIVPHSLRKHSKIT